MPCGLQKTGQREEEISYMEKVGEIRAYRRMRRASEGENFTYAPDVESPWKNQRNQF